MSAIFGSISTFIVDLIETAVIGISIFLIVYLFFMQPHQVSGHSMHPYLLDKDYVLTDKISYRLGDPKRGDIVVFHAPEAANCPEGAGCDYIKRVIGLPGETVEVKNDQIFINGKALPEPYLAENTDTLPGSFIRDRAVKLGAREYFVVGDNRMHSSDSRVWGPIQPEMIVGRAFFRYWPVQTMQQLKDPVYAGF